MTDIEELQDSICEIANICQRLQELGILQNPSEVVELFIKLEKLLGQELLFLVQKKR